MLRYSTAAARRAALAILSVGLIATATSATDAQTRPANQPPQNAVADEPKSNGKSASPPLTIDLKPSALMQGHDLRAIIKVTPESGNRLLSVAIDAPTFYASTERELMGDTSPRTYTFKWDKLPAGQYKVEAVVTDAAGRLTRVQREFLVHGGTLDGEMEPTQPTPGRRGRGRR